MPASSQDDRAIAGWRHRPMARHGEFPYLPRFAYVRRLGAGGMGTVYEAFDRERGMAVALKTLNRPPEGRHILRFKNEFRVLQELRHQNLVQIYELIEHERSEERRVGKEVRLQLSRDT